MLQVSITIQCEYFAPMPLGEDLLIDAQACVWASALLEPAVSEG